MAQGGDPEKDFSDLTTAFNTLKNYAGNQDIVIREGNYTDKGLTVPANITGVVGDGPDVVVFTGDDVADFLDISGIPAGFVLSGMTITHYNRGVVGFAGGNTGTISGIIFRSNAYGAVFAAGCTNKTVQDNCFFSSTTLNTYDDNGNTWNGNYYDDYTVANSYAIGGGGGMVDNNPKTLNNSAVFAGPANLDEVFEVPIWFTFPACEETRNLAAYNFKANYYAADLQFQSARFEYAFYGPDVPGGEALYIGPDGSVAGQVGFAASNWTTPATASGIVGYVTFKAKAANKWTPIYITSTYLDKDNNSLVVGNTTQWFELKDVTPPTLAITPYADVDNNPATLGAPILDPRSGKDAYSDGSTAGAGPWVKFYLDMVGGDDYDLDRIEYNWDDAGWNIWGAYSGLSGTTFTLPSPIYIDITGQGAGVTHNLKLQMVDKGANKSLVQEYEFFIDRTGPNLVSLAVSDKGGCARVPADYTNQALINLALGDDGLDVIKEIDLTTTAWGVNPRVPWKPTTYLLPAPGAYTVWGRCYDLWNNEGGWQNDLMNYDITPPATSQDFLLAGNAAKCNSLNTTGDVSNFGADGWGWMYSENAGALVCTGAWTQMPPWPHPFAVALQAGIDQERTVYFRTIDAAGNMSPLQNDKIVLDRAAPTPAAVASDPGTGSTECTDLTPDWRVNVTVNYPESDVYYIYITDGVNGSWYSNAGNPIPSGTVHSFAAVGTAQGATLTLTVNAYDNSLPASNMGSCSSNPILADWASPTFASVEMKDRTSGSSIWSNETMVKVYITASTDIKELRFSKDNSTWGAWQLVNLSSGSAVVDYDYTSPVPTTYLPLFVEGKDCSGNVGSGSDAAGIIFDLTAPTLSNVSINAGALKTGNPAVQITFTCFDFYPKNVAIANNAAMTSPTVYAWGGGGGPYAFTLPTPPNDGPKDVWVQLEDQVGNFSAIVKDPNGIMLDQTGPTGTYVVKQVSNPDAMPGYTNNQNVSLINFVPDPDAVTIYVQNTGSGGDGTLPSYFSPITDTPWKLKSGQGLKTLQVYFIDDVGNWGAAVPGEITFDNQPPVALASFTAEPGGSALLTWSADPQAQKYFIKYNFNGDYPVYTNPNPPPPAWNEGFPADGPIVVLAPQVVDTFPGPQMDIYCFSIWTMDKAGNINTATAASKSSNLSTNYIPGDFLGGSSADGCIDYENEFFALAAAYGSALGGPYYDPEVDISPAAPGPDYYPIPDGLVNFDDFVIFGINYRDWNCANMGGGSGKIVATPMTITALSPQQVLAGETFSVALTTTNAAAIVGYHLVLGYDQKNLEIVKVEPGAMQASLQKGFLYRTNPTGLDMVGIALGGQFQGEEMAVVTFRAVNPSTVDLNAVTVDLRDWGNKQVPTSFNVTAKVEGLIPKEFALSQNYPNPFNPTTTIDLSLPVAGNYTLTIYNITGQVVETFSGHAEAGVVPIEWNAAAHSSGIYLYKVEAGSFSATRKMVLLK